MDIERFFKIKFNMNEFEKIIDLKNLMDAIKKNEKYFFNKKDLKFLGKNTIIGKTVRIRKPEKVSIGENTIVDDFIYFLCNENRKKLSVGRKVINGGDQIIEIGDNVDIGANSTISTSSSNFLVASISSAAVNKNIILEQFQKK